MDLSSYLQPIYEKIGLGDADTRQKVFFGLLFVASVGLIHFKGAYRLKWNYPLMNVLNPYH